MANKNLPDCYTDKEEIIKRTASFPWILGDINVLINLHEKGILNSQYCEKIKNMASVIRYSSRNSKAHCKWNI